MTKEEQWKREAEIKLDELDDRGFDFDNWSISDAYERGYCDCAEPRENLITELEATNKKISNECHKLVDSLEKKQKVIAELQHKIDILQGYLDRDVEYQELQKENAEAKNLIEELASSLSVVGECGEEECELINKAQKFINKPIF